MTRSAARSSRRASRVARAARLPITCALAWGLAGCSAPGQSAEPLTASEREAIIESVVPAEPFHPDLQLCQNQAGPRRDARGEVYETDATGVSIEAPGCILGPKVIGTFSRDLGWHDVKKQHDGDGVRWSRPEPGLVHVLGAYFDNIEDALGPPKSPDTTRESTWRVEHSYARYTRDDFVENDACLDGTIHDVLVDGSHVFISARPGRGNQAEMAQYAATHTVSNTLVRLDCQPDPRTDTQTSCPVGQSTGMLFKWSDCGGVVNMRDSIILVEGRPRKGTSPMDFPPGHYENVWLIYTGPEDAYPGRLPAEGVTEVDDLELWHEARRRWLERHGCDPNGDHCTMLDP